MRLSNEKPSVNIERIGKLQFATDRNGEQSDIYIYSYQLDKYFEDIVEIPLQEKNQLKVAFGIEPVRCHCNVSTFNSPNEFQCGEFFVLSHIDSGLFQTFSVYKQTKIMIKLWQCNEQHCYWS